MEKATLDNVERVAGSGKVVMAADDYNVVSIVRDAIISGKSATFYASLPQAKAVKAWYWTPDRVEQTGIKKVSSEEKAKIASELGVEDIGSFRCNRIQCECGQVYGAFEFLQQGVKEHGRDTVLSVFALKDAAVMRVNPPDLLVCPNCDELLPERMWYDNGTYGCCFGTEE
ncbi:hypothetical protein ACFVFI_12485 [Streptomyces sp. NPDC057705]|uniref:hypothetical protein n=1 Tax=Streptomyces sp. NPDC057705 TaxID=3346222 RepID=UPI0036B8A82E